MASKDEQPGQVKPSVDTTEPSQANSSQRNPMLILRRLAQKYLQERKIWPPKEHEAPSYEKAQHIIQELEIHQIELEMQNEELRQTQLELDFARARYFDLYDMAPVGYCTVSDKGIILETNLTAANLLSVDRRVLVNQPFSRFILREDQDIFYLLRKQLLETGKQQSGELRLIRQDGSFFWVNLETTVGLNESGMTVSRIVLSSIAKRKRAEEALQKSHRQNQAILDSITDAFISLSNEMIISYFNTVAEEILKWKQLEVIGRNLFDVFPEGKGSIFENNCAEAIRTQTPVSFESKFNVAGCQNWYGVRVYPSLDGITISLRVITERRKMDGEKARLRSIKRQLQKSESLERMAGAIAHLFNNHFQVALINLELALHSLATDAVPRKYLINAIKATHRSSDVSGLLLTYLGQDISKTEPLNLSQICQKSLPGIEAAAPNGVSIETRLSSPGPIVLVNASQIRQVLSIVITNAMEAIRDHAGKITVDIKSVPASIIPTSHVSHIEWLTTSEMFACLEVTDTGCGMSREEMGKIFDPFYTTKFTGRGLGLSVAMSLVKAWGGMIHVKSKTNTGSCFRVFLPLTAVVVPLQADFEREQETSSTKGTVLLVDDDFLASEAIETMLEYLGFAVITAVGGIEAVALFRKHHKSIDCLLTDLSMPDMDGWETLAVLRKVKPNLPAILASGYDEARAMNGEHKELPQAFLHKPYTKKDLENVLNRVLNDAARSSN